MIQTIPQLRLLLHRGRVFERFQLKEIGVFGSFARNEAFNDLDLLVSHPQKSSLSHLLRLREWLEKALPYPVDIVVEEFANPILLHRAKKDLKMLRASENDLLHLLDMLQRMAKIRYYAKDFHTEWHFYEAEMQLYFNACLNLLAQLGEKTNKLSDELKNAHSEIAWKEIKGYEGVNIAQTFEIIKVHLPELQTRLEALIREELAKETFSPAEFEVAKDSEFYSEVDFSRIGG